VQLSEGRVVASLQDFKVPWGAKNTCFRVYDLQ